MTVRIESKRERVRTPPPPPHRPSGSHQRLTQEGAAMPCWGTRERLLFPPSAAETTISQCIALHCIIVRCSAVPCTAERPILTRAGVPAAAWDQALTPRQTSTEQPHIPAESACQEALGTERKRPRTESWSR